MQQEDALKLPTNLLIMDAVGTLLLGLGLAEWLANTGLVPIAWRFEHYPFFIIAVGVLLCAPLINFIFSRIRARRSRETT